MSDAKATQHYVRELPNTWWTSNSRYTVFFFRELSAIPVAVVVLLQLYLVYQLGQGPEAFGAALEILKSPASVAFHAVALVFVLLHTVTWFRLNAQIMEVRTGETAMNPNVMVVAEYAAWAVISAGIAYVIVA
ncbi:MAG: hypothetical protein KTR31_23920 [Myxococcales bacterium]|nr:hypothetical protein [Myxococcales bacterium]